MEQTYNAEKIYEELLTSTEMLEYVQNQCGMSWEVKELVTVGIITVVNLRQRRQLLWLPLR